MLNYDINLHFLSLIIVYHQYFCGRNSFVSLLYVYTFLSNYSTTGQKSVSSRLLDTDIPSQSDWATEMDAEDWRTKHQKIKLDKKDWSVEDVLVASASADGTIRLWRPLVVSQTFIYSLTQSCLWYSKTVFGDISF